jgi:putative oxygen-independent coproporphyrinogen III oxidase
MSGVGHLYVHLPFCAHRCGYCDFVTLVGRAEGHGAYVDALLAELELERDVLEETVETVFLGGGTPTFTDPRELERLLRALPAAAEVTVEANPETVTPDLAALLRDAGVTRVSLGAQTFDPKLLEVLERRAGPEDVRQAFYHLRGACFDNISLDLIYGIPGQTTSGLRRDLAEAAALGPEHLSCYELEAKQGTRFTHAWGAELLRQGEAMEGYFELVVEVLEDVGYRWYETANFCRDGRQARHNLGYWLGRDYLGLGIGAVSTVGGVRWRNSPRLALYLGVLGAGKRPPRDVEELDARTRLVERVMLGLRLDRPLCFEEVEEVLDPIALDRLEGLGLVELSGGDLRLTRRGRFLGGGVTAELIAEIPAKELELSA